MCGPVDEEISVPELVKEGSLCPHQDYVYFNYPSKEEEEMVKTFRKNGEEMMAQLMEDPSLATAVSGHPALLDFDGWYEYMLEKPPYLSALLIYCQEKGIAFSPKWLKLLQIKKLPEMNEKWMEFFLQGFLFEDAKQYACDNVYREQLIKRLKAHGLLERNHVGFLLSLIHIFLEKDIHFYSFCEHHMLPFYGSAAIAYIPNGEVVGLSKIARTVEVFAKRFQLQERLTAQIADVFMEELNPKGVMVLIEAEHMCMTMRGIKKPGTKTVTVVTRGVFDQDEKLQNQFYRMLERRS